MHDACVVGVRCSGKAWQARDHARLTEAVAANFDGDARGRGGCASGRTVRDIRRRDARIAASPERTLARGGLRDAGEAPCDTELRDTRADLVCDRFDVCAGHYLRLWYVDESACRAGERHNCVRDTALPGIVDARATLDECVASLRSMTCTQRGATRSIFCAPRKPGLGTLPDNSSCFVDAQCAGGACGLIGPNLFGCGRCERLRVEGEACKGSCGGLSTELRGELRCDGFTNQCVRAVVGAKCVPGVDDDGLLFCTPDGVRGVPTAKLGEPCGPYRGGCSEGFCDLTTAKCAPYWPSRFARLGEPCGNVAGADDAKQCTGGTWCGPLTASVYDRTCQPTRAVGTKCSGGFECGHTASCVRADYASCVDARPECPTPPPAIMDAGAPPDAATVTPPPPPSPPVLASDVASIEVDDRGTLWKFTITAACRVTDGKGLDKTGDTAKCAELFRAAVDTTWPDSGGCGKSDGAGNVTLRLTDGRVFVRDLSADRCAVLLPSIMTEKLAYVVWRAVGGM